jgi:outer membrane protein
MRAEVQKMLLFFSIFHEGVCMRSLINKLAVAGCILAAPVLLLAQSTAPGKVGILDLQQAISSTQEGKQDLTQLQKKYAPKRDDLQQQSKAISALQDRIQNQSSMLSDDERYQIERELTDKQRIFKEAQDDYQYDTQEDEQEVVSTIGAKMMKLVAQYAAQHGFALVIANQQNLVLYASRPVDITQDIVKLYDSTYPVGAASSPAAKPASTAGAKH